MHLSDRRVMQFEDADVAAALAAARAGSGAGEPPEQGSVGAGKGMCLGFSGGIGTSSRVIPEGYTPRRGHGAAGAAR